MMGSSCSSRTDGTVENGNESHLISACMKGRIKVAKALIQSGSNVNLEDERKMTALHYACDFGHAEIAKSLIRSGADVNPRERGNISALHYGCMRGYVEIAELLIQSGASVNAEDERKMTVLLYACESGHVEIVKTLIRSGADVNASDYGNNTALHYACFKGYVEIAELLIQSGAKVDADSGWTPLKCACVMGYMSIAKLLIESGANVNYENEGKRTALQEACNQGHADIAELLIQSGADVSAENEEHQTALLIACEKRHFDIVELLIKSGSSVNDGGQGKWSPLHHACGNGQIEIVKLLVLARANVNCEGPSRLRPIHLASTNNANMLEYLLQHGADVEATDEKGRTALHIVCSQENGVPEFPEWCSRSKKTSTRERNAVVEVLLRCGVGLDSKDESGDTPLHYCVAGNHVELAKTLTDAGADVNLTNNQGKVPLRLNCCDVEMLRTFFEGGADLKLCIKNSEFDLHFRMRKDYLRRLQLLLDYGLEEFMCKCCRGYEINTCRGEPVGGATVVVSCGPSLIAISTDELGSENLRNRPFLKHEIKSHVAASRDRSGLVQSAYTKRQRAEITSFIHLCEKELVSVKCDLIGDSGKSYHDLLNQHQPLGDYVKHLPRYLTSSEVRQKYPIYGDMLYKRFVPLRKLLHVEHCASFFKLLYPRLPPECGLMILQLLSIRDLKIAEICDESRK